MEANERHTERDVAEELVRCASCGEYEDPGCMSEVGAGLCCIDSGCAVFEAVSDLGFYRRASDEKLGAAIAEMETLLQILKVERDVRAARLNARSLASMDFVARAAGVAR